MSAKRSVKVCIDNSTKVKSEWVAGGGTFCVFVFRKYASARLEQLCKQRRTLK